MNTSLKAFGLSILCAAVLAAICIANVAFTAIAMIAGGLMIAAIMAVASYMILSLASGSWKSETGLRIFVSFSLAAGIYLSVSVFNFLGGFRGALLALAVDFLWTATTLAVSIGLTFWIWFSKDEKEK